jgi:hypothetical protein
MANTRGLLDYIISGDSPYDDVPPPPPPCPGSHGCYAVARRAAPSRSK